MSQSPTEDSSLRHRRRLHRLLAPFMSMSQSPTEDSSLRHSDSWGVHAETDHFVPIPYRGFITPPLGNPVPPAHNLVKSQSPTEDSSLRHYQVPGHSGIIGSSKSQSPTEDSSLRHLVQLSGDHNHETRPNPLPRIHHSATLKRVTTCQLCAPGHNIWTTGPRALLYLVVYTDPTFAPQFPKTACHGPRAAASGPRRQRMTRA